MSADTTGRHASHWFYWSVRNRELRNFPGGFEIRTFRLGEQFSGVYWYETADELRAAVIAFESDGYDNMTGPVPNEVES